MGERNSKRAPRENGAVMIEAILIIFLILGIVFVAMKMSYRVREAYVVKEAARHGGRSALARVIDERADFDCDTAWLGTGENFVCDSANMGPADPSLFQTAIFSTCEFLRLAGENPGSWTVTASIPAGASESFPDGANSVAPGRRIYVLRLALDRAGGSSVLDTSSVSVSIDFPLCREIP